MGCSPTTTRINYIWNVEWSGAIASSYVAILVRICLLMLFMAAAKRCVHLENTVAVTYTCLRTTTVLISMPGTRLIHITQVFYTLPKQALLCDTHKDEKASHFAAANKVKLQATAWWSKWGTSHSNTTQQCPSECKICATASNLRVLINLRWFHFVALTDKIDACWCLQCLRCIGNKWIYKQTICT